jgi:hypothetical protein
MEQRRPYTRFEEYLDWHRDKIQLHWHYQGATSDLEEYIIMDDVVSLLYKKENEILSISIDFSDNTTVRKNGFEQIGHTKSTEEFIDQFILSAVSTFQPSFSEEENKLVVDYLKSLK